MKSIFLPEAEAEFLEASRYYELEAPGVGMAFIVEVHRAVKAIVARPLSAPEVRGNIRKKLINRFPYNLLYAFESDQIVIVAVAHHKRRPTYWQSRLSSKSSRP